MRIWRNGKEGAVETGNLSLGLVAPFLQFHPFSLIFLFFTRLSKVISQHCSPYISILVTTP